MGCSYLDDRLTYHQLQRLVIAPSQLHPPKIGLTQDQQHYLMRVLRLEPGDRFLAMDGQGHTWVAQLQQPHAAQEFAAEIVEAVATQTELPVLVTLVAALPKGNGFDDVVRQATELGVACIVPVVSARTLLHPSSQKLDRWRRIAQEAAEQSERQIVPNLLEPVPLMERLQLETGPDPKYLCVTRKPAPHLLDCLLQHQTERKPIVGTGLTVAIGPEGGWTGEEVEAAIRVGYQPVSLGQRIFRTVTAPTVALSLIAAAFESTAV